MSKNGSENIFEIVQDFWNKSNPEDIKDLGKNLDFSTQLKILKIIEYSLREEKHKFLVNDKVKRKAVSLIEFLSDFLTDHPSYNILEIFNMETIDSFKFIQSGKSVDKEFDVFKTGNIGNYRKIFIASNSVYENFYELILGFLLKPLAERIENKNIINKGLIIKSLKEYKNGKYKDLFSCFNGQIRNSIAHKDFLIDHKKPEIKFLDKNKPPIILGYADYAELLGELLSFLLALGYLSIAVKENIMDSSFAFFEKVEKMEKILKSNSRNVIKE